MINITFIKSGDFDVSQIPEQWHPYVSVVKIPAFRPVTQAAEIGGNVTPGEIVVRQAYNSRVTIAVQPDDSSYRYRALMQPRQMMLKFSLPFFFEFPVGSSVVYERQTYYVKRPEDIKKQGTRNIEYSMTLSTDDSSLGDYKMRNTVDGRLKWSMCARPHEFVEEIVKNLNTRMNTTKWKVGKCIESTEKTVEFNHSYLDAALTDIASAFETEWEITDDCTINLCKVEYNKDKTDMLALSYGRGNGFVPGVGRTSEVGGEPVKRLYVQGGDRNINRATYGEMLGLDDKPGELLLPLSQRIEYEGRTYESDAHGYYIERVDVISDATKDDSLDCSEIYPSRIGKCSDVIEVDAKKNFYDFVDDSIPANLDFNSYLIPGETMTVIFQTGMLAGDGKEFEVKYYHNSVNGKSARRFEIVPQEIDGITMPNETFKPKFGENGDTYAVFGIQLPKEYICNNDDKSGASWDMMREAARKLHDCEEQKFTFTGELQSMWAKRNWERVGGNLVVGGYILFTDAQFAPSGTPIRIVGIKDYLTNPYAPTVELSNSITSPGSASSSLRQIDNTEIVVDDTKREIMQFTKRRFRDALETIGMLEDAQLANFTGAITPVAIQTMAMLVGDESLQFLMGKTLASIGSGDWFVNWNGNALVAPSGFLRHMTIGVNAITAERDTGMYNTWRMPSMNLTPKADSKYYLYAVVNRIGMTYNTTLGGYVNSSPGEWLLDNESHAIDENPNKYHLLVGILNSEYLGERSFATMYGFTEILPGQITTDVVKSSDGESYFNLAHNRFKLGDKLGFNVNDDGVLRLRGALVQSSSGDESPLPCYRGVYSATARYYRGDLVSYKSNGNTSMYICKTTSSTGIVGIAPTSTGYWALYAEGAQGQPGAPGLNAPIMVFRGNWDSTKTYYGNTSRVDCVKSGDTFFVAQMTAPNGTTGFSGEDADTTNDEYWKSFGASYESVATSLLLAENATIGNWFISGNNIVSTHGTVNGVESDDFTHANFRPDVILDGATGELILYSGKYPRVRLSNSSVNELFNESLLNEATINRQFYKSITQYIPYANNIYKCSVGVLGSILIGQMNEDSEIKISDFVVEFVVPGNRNDTNNQVGVVAFVDGADMKINIRKNGNIVQTFSGMRGSNASKGDTLRQSHGASRIYKVPSGGAGNYSIEFVLEKIGWTATRPGKLRTFDLRTYISGSYVHGGFNRTVIGNDGIGSFWDDAVFVFSKNGLVTRFGKIGFKVSKDGVQKCTNFNTENPKWDPM